MAVESVESLCQQAKEAIARKEIEAARQLYLEALALRAEAPDVHFGLATVCYMLDDLESAAYHFKEVTRLDPLRAGAFVNLGAVFNRLGELDEALRALRRGVQIDPKRAEGHYNLGLVYRKRGQTNLAVQAYLEATRLNPRMVDAHYNLANLYFELERFGLAAARYKQALQLRPKWQKAEEGLALAQAALRTSAQPTIEAAAPTLPAKKPAPLDPHRLVDPHVHGTLLSSLHKATIESEYQGHHFLEIIEHEIEPVIKEMSSVLVASNQGSAKLSRYLERFENAIQNMRKTQRELESCIDRVRNLGDRLVKTEARPAG